VAYGASDRGDPDGTLCKSGVELTVGSMQHIRTFHMDWEATLAGSEPGEVEYAISSQECLVGRVLKDVRSDQLAAR